MDGEKKVSYFSLFGVFAKIGAVTFGGGYAMLPMLQRELVEKRNWCTETNLLDYFAVGQCTPGIIAVNTATFVGSPSGTAAKIRTILVTNDSITSSSTRPLCSLNDIS